MITIKIDVTKITKERLYKGAKGTYLDAILIETPNSEYGDYMIKESLSKEERESGKEGVILGNAKVYKQQSTPVSQENNDDTKSDNGGDGLPF